MQQSFFQAVATAVNGGNSATIEVQGLTGGVIKVIYTPNLGATPENATTEVVNLRAAIAKPIVVSGTPEEVEAAFTDHIKNKVAVVARGMSLLDEIERLGSAAKEKAQSTPAKAVAPAAQQDDDSDELDGDEEVISVTPAAPTTPAPIGGEF